jgi:hypothetical protein
MGAGFAELRSNSVTSLHLIDLRTGSSINLGAIGGRATNIGGLALQDNLPSAPAVGLSTDGTTLTRLSTSTPGTGVSAPALTGVTAGETLVGIDWRPQTGQLYAIRPPTRAPLTSSTRKTVVRFRWLAR